MIFLDNTLHAFQPIAVPEFIRLGRKQLLIRRERIAAAAVDQCDHDHICIMMPDIKFNGGAGECSALPPAHYPEDCQTAQ